MSTSQTVSVRHIVLVGLPAMLIVLATAWSASAQSSELPPGGTFWDDDGSVHEGMIEAIVAEGITQGCTEDGRNYCPGTPVTRGQMSTFLTRALDLPPADRDYFPDDDGSVHEDSINRIAAAEITSGRPDGTFGPDDPVTREQMATFLAIALDLPAASDSRFDDVSGIHESNVDRVAQAEITVGCNSEGTLFCPRDHVTRGQMATFLGRALGLTATVPPPRPEPQSDGAAAWGWNASGTLGDGNLEVVRQPTPVDVRGSWAEGAPISDVAIGTQTTCAIAAGDVYCWGYNQWGQVGDGTTVTRALPTIISGGGDLPRGGATNVTISFGGALDGHTCVVADGAVYCWGINASGRLGDGTTTDRDRPVRVSGALSGRHVTAIEAGEDHVCALADGDVYCWGNNGSGQLGIRGDGGSSQEALGISEKPVALDDRGELPDTEITDIAATQTTSCAIADGEIYCWGQLVEGDGFGRVTTTPTAIDRGDIPAGLAVDAIDGGFEHFCALAGGNVYCWGENFWTGQQFGNGIDTDQPSPVAVDTSGPLPAGQVTAISAGKFHSCVVAAGEVYCWGANGQGELGDGSSVDRRSFPVAVDTSGVLADRRAINVSAGSRMTIISTAPK